MSMKSVAGAGYDAGPEGLSFSPAAVASLAPSWWKPRKMFACHRANLCMKHGAPRDARSKAVLAARLARWSKRGLAAAPITPVFLNHLGRPVINLGSRGDYGVYQLDVR